MSTTSITTEGITTTTINPARSFYRYGHPANDNTIFRTDDGSTRIGVPNGFSFYSEKFTEVYVNTNGYVSLGNRYGNSRPTPLPIPGYNIVAPLWLDLDLTYSYGQESEGVIYYQRYEHFSTAALADEVLDLYLTLQKEIQEAHGDTSFEPHLIIVITWINCPRHPYRESRANKERASFQLVLTQDYRSDRSYALFLYGEIIITNYRIPNIQGYSQSTTVTHELLTSNITMAGLSQAEGTAGRPGRWVFRTSRPEYELTEDSATYKCHAWALTQEEPQRLSDIRIADWLLPDCPCTYFQGVFDGRFFSSPDPERDNCLLSFSFWWFGSYSRMCCYTRNTFTGWWWDWTSRYGFLDRSLTFEGGSLVEYDPWQFYSQYLFYDDAPKRHCCLESNNCHVFYRYRPSDSCFWYQPPWFSWTWGDPHVATIDGKKYSFQGIGEFTLMESNVTIIQGRAEQTKDINGNTVAATVWTGIAMKDISNTNTGGATPTVSVSLNTTRTGLVINVQNDDLTDWFINSESTMTESNDVILLKNNSKVTAQLPSGISVSVEMGVTQLVFSVVIPNNLQGYKIRGLLGNANRDASDDFQLPDDTILANNLTEERIYYDFALKWRVLGNSDKYLFSTDPVPVPTDYVPTFNEPNPVFSADESAICGSDTFCLLDLRVTNNSDFASQTKEINSQNTANQLELGKEVPVILGPVAVNIIVGRNISITLTSNNTASAVNFSINTIPSGASFDAQTGVLTWQVPYLLSPVELIFGVKTKEGTEGVPLPVVLTLCNCTEDTGICTGETIISLTPYFNMDMCRCLDMYEGEFCTEPRDYCAESPCVPGATCNNLSGMLAEDSPGYNCTDCPKGYKESAGNTKCDDVDECGTGDNRCEQTCINLDGSYKCECEAGYVVNNITECADIDECLDGTASCEQICNNTDGSYACECHDGFTLSSNVTCVQDEATKIGCTNLTCEYGCRLNGSVPECFCQRGYQINTTETTLCDDIDECVGGTHRCGPNSTCVNLPGTYSCSCHNGYLLNDDQRTCRVCDPLYWGQNCTNMCTKCESAADCDPIMGCTKCTEGWTGEPHCNQDVKECDVNGSCPENSTCQELPGSFRCTCDDGYRATTTKCIDIDDCTEVNGTQRIANPCNNGTCNDHLLGYNCTCFAGFTGDYCTTNIDDCGNNTCEFGSTCVDLVNSYQCMCLPGFYSISCEKSACVRPTVSGTAAVTHRGFLIVKNIEYDDKMADPDSDIYKDIYSKTINKIILIYSCLENRTNTLFRALNDVRFTETNSVNISWALVLTQAISEDVLVDALDSRINLFTGLAFQNISYADVIPPPDSTSNNLAIILGTIGGLVGVVIITVSVVMAMKRSRSLRQRTSPHVLDSSMDRIIGMQPHGRRWMDIPSLHADVQDPFVIPRVVLISPRPMSLVTPGLVTPGLDWNALKRARNARCGVTGRPTAARFSVSNSDLNGRRQLDDYQSKWTWSTSDYSQNR